MAQPVGARPLARSVCGEPAEHQREDVDEHQPARERRRGQRHHAEALHGPVGGPPVAQAGQDAQRQSDEQRDGEAQTDQLAGEHQPVAECGADALAGTDRRTEIEPDGVAQPVPVLHGHRAVQVVAGPDGGQRLGGGAAGTEQRLGRITRCGLEQGEHGDGQHDEESQRAAETAHHEPGGERGPQPRPPGDGHRPPPAVRGTAGPDGFRGCRRPVLPREPCRGSARGKRPPARRSVGRPRDAAPGGWRATARSGRRRRGDGRRR